MYSKEGFWKEVAYHSSSLERPNQSLDGVCLENKKLKEERKEIKEKLQELKDSLGFIVTRDGKQTAGELLQEIIDSIKTEEE